MARRRLSTLLAAMIAAIMIGMRDATGLAPPPPLFITEEVHWLSPELDGDSESTVWVADPSEADVTRTIGAEAVERRLGLFRKMRSRLSRLVGHEERHRGGLSDRR